MLNHIKVVYNMFKGKGRGLMAVKFVKGSQHGVLVVSVELEPVFLLSSFRGDGSHVEVEVDNNVRAEVDKGPVGPR